MPPSSRYRTVIVAALVATPLHAQPAGGDPVESRLDRVFAEYARPEAPGCAVGVSRNGTLRIAKGYGSLNVEQARPIASGTTFNLGSVGKQFTAMAALLLEQQGRLSLDADVRKYVPEMPVFSTPVRVRDLLYHTSGLRDFGTLALISGQPVITMQDFLVAMGRQRGLNFPPGSRQEYSHSDYTLLALVIERAAGDRFGAVLQRLIFAPLGMRSTVLVTGSSSADTNRAVAHAPSKQGYLIRRPAGDIMGNSNLYSTATDLLRWDANLTSAQLGGRALVDRLLARPAIKPGEPTPYRHGIWSGEYRGLPTLYRGGGGSGFATEYVRFPDQKLAVAVLCNVQPSHPRPLSRAAAEIFLDGVRLAAGDSLRDSVPAPPAELVKYAGRYRPLRDRWNTIQIEARGNRLVEVIGGDAYPLTRLANGRYHDDTPIFYTFTPDPATGRVRLTLTGNDVFEVSERLPDSAPYQGSPRTASEAAGTYESREGATTWTLSARGPQLFLNRPGLPEVALQPVDDDWFRAAASSDQNLPPGLHLRRNARGVVTGFTLSWTPRPFESVNGMEFERQSPR